MIFYSFMFLYFQKLKYHIRKHTGEGLINCEICSKVSINNL